MGNADPSNRGIDVLDLARTGGTVEGALALDSAGRLRSSLATGDGRLTYRFTGRIDALGRPAGELELRGEVPLTCDRCGAIVRQPIEHRAQFYFVLDETELGRLPVLVDEPEPLLGGRAFDLAALVEDEAILSLPLSPRHESCARGHAQDGSADDHRRAKPFAGLSGLLRKG